MKSEKIVLFLALGLLVASVILLITFKDKIAISDAVQILITLALVLVTFVYVIHTANIADKTRQQAEATVRMVKQMVKPKLMPEIFLEGGLFEEHSVESNVIVSNRSVKFKATVSNDGNGSAYDVELSIEDDSKPPSILVTRDKISVIRKGDEKNWQDPSLYLYFPYSDKLQRRFFIIRYKDIDGEYEIRQPFVLTTAGQDMPCVRPESISRHILKKQDLEDELP